MMTNLTTKQKTVSACVWCGKAYEEHRDKPFPNGAVAKTPCGLLKSGFHANNPTPTNLPTETVSDVIETWKLDLERLLWSYHENGRPDGKTGLIGNPKTIEEFVLNLMDSQYKMGKQDGRAMRKRAYCEVCRVLIDADTGEREKYA